MRAVPYVLVVRGEPALWDNAANARAFGRRAMSREGVRPSHTCWSFGANRRYGTRSPRWLASGRGHASTYGSVRKSRPQPAVLRFARASVAAAVLLFLGAANDLLVITTCSDPALVGTLAIYRHDYAQPLKGFAFD